MVQFSEIIRTRMKNRQAAALEQPLQDEKVRLSDFSMREIEEKRQDSSDLLLADQVDDKVKAYYTELLEKSMDVRNKVKEDLGISPSPVLSVLHNIIKDGLIDGLYKYAISFPKDYGLPSHDICVTLASMKIGVGMEYDTESLLKLGLAAFLENVGMYKIPDHILKKTGVLSHGEIEILKKHTLIGAQILDRMGSAFEWLPEIALQVHERTDGSGYPNGLEGDEIREFASIIGLIDTYVAMIRHRPYRDKYVQTEAVKSILEIGNKGKFPPKVVKEFLHQISLFPVNTCVKLNNKSIGRVLLTDKRQPVRPVIELLYDGQGKKIDKRTIVHLSEAPLLHIVGTIDEEQLP
jgi:HD-GYP domain-containing protein (c-di-GMP phosphodiesterase class II)